VEETALASRTFLDNELFVTLAVDELRATAYDELETLLKTRTTLLEDDLNENPSLALVTVLFASVLFGDSYK